MLHCISKWYISISVIFGTTNLQHWWCMLLSLWHDSPYVLCKLHSGRNLWFALGKTINRSLCSDAVVSKPITGPRIGHLVPCLREKIKYSNFNYFDFACFLVLKEILFWKITGFCPSTMSKNIWFKRKINPNSEWILLKICSQICLMFPNIKHVKKRSCLGSGPETLVS